MRQPRLTAPPKEPLNTAPHMGGGFHFIATLLDVQIELPVQITPTIIIDRADQSQIEVIQHALDNAAGALGLSLIHRSKYESDMVPNEDGNGMRGEPLPMERWRYYILAFSGYGNDVQELLKISYFVRPFISCFLWFTTAAPFGCGVLYGRGTDPVGNQIFYSGIRHKGVLDSVAIASLRSALDLYARLDPVKHEGIRRAVEAHAELRRFEQASRLAVLAQFAIMEMLLTHNPNDKEIGDSITHQLKTKLALINGRMVAGFDYSVFTKKAPNPEKLWSALYAYRSAIAHGGHIDFEGRLKVLVSEETARGFIASATRIIINYALEEPDLVNALKPI